MSHDQIINNAAVAKARILVVGDVMLDRYWFGDVARISPEAPVPVVKINRQEERLGGAANVARNAAALGASTALLSVVGADEAGSSIQRLLAESNIQAHLHEDEVLDTIIKLRVIGRQQQLLRIDFETPPSQNVLADKLARFHTLLPDCDLVILSDYGKGGLTHIESMIAAANALHIPVLVDPKGDDYARYRHATVLTPNLAEFRVVAGSWQSEEEFRSKAEALRKSLDLTALLVTRSEAGMTLFSAEGVVHQATVAREVFDVSGAGDTVIATLGVMLAAGKSLDDSVALANRAAGIVVAKLGTAVVLPEELWCE
ncbi:D-glycero-beta-D-manno-heptose-7-phosphate kinase [Sulfuriferula thiophila]|uniref:D-glycero-beta-D-manno-heptose-7-phosphate kinase n=1 Tax=Sulfuriferula thiophila TaxID=1781211 RepID=UPI000F60F804|nr:D-glycero-beta-D-manno-heptose-7-phosphate kinase [Sulfuriferula thiophila]